MPITPSLRHCSNKYKLAREGEKEKEKDEDFEKVKVQFFFCCWGQWNTDGGLGEQMDGNACVRSESHSPANTEHWPPAHSHPSAFMWPAVTPLYRYTPKPLGWHQKQWHQAKWLGDRKWCQIPSIFPWKHTIALLWKNSYIKLYKNSYTHPHIVPNLYNILRNTK